jgi:hypothetical protein
MVFKYIYGYKLHFTEWVVIPRQRRRDIVLALSVRPSVRPSVHPSGTFVSGAISWKCFGGFHWNFVWVYICIRGWCTPNGIVHHLLTTELWPFVTWKNAFYNRHFCVRSHILEVLWRISLKLRMSIHLHKRMMHAKWHCTPSVKNRVMALCILKKCF